MPFAEQTVIGESFVGSGPNAAHTNIVLGRKGGPVETAWVTALASPSAGYAPFVAVLAPNVPIAPRTLFVNKAAITGELHGNATWGAAQAGLATGITQAIGEGLIPADELENLLIIAAIWVNPLVDDLDEAFRNQRDAAFGAVRAALAGCPTPAELAATAISNPFYTPSPAVTS
ncbi:MAG TPA: formaldehyde-activating enzyme [Pseudonocardiaceae bacterium]|jgi:5,6,7,8-tetrahydromethanopterin hydro-lyase|nr:formaldehyde-activating enzyme [Pseudonocardiaceae bacterium]